MGVAKSWHRPPPVLPVPEGGSLDAGDLFPPGDKAGAPAALYDLAAELLRRVDRIVQASAPVIGLAWRRECSVGHYRS